MRAIVNGVRPLGVPVIYFVNAAPHLLELAATSAPTCSGSAGARRSTRRRDASARPFALQGNLDPHALFRRPGRRPGGRDGGARSRGGPRGHIMNLGHGILPDTPIAGVEALIAAVHEHADHDTTR